MTAPEDRSRNDRDSLEATHTAGSTDGSAGAPAGAPREWGGLRVIGELGHGGGGHVYRAWDPTLARDVALKIIRVPTPEHGAALLREGRLLARVQHPNVVVVYGARQIGGEIGLWMELVRGRTLAEVVKQDGPMGADEATVIGTNVCRALAAVHGAGLVHRDVKAHNVMRESGGRVVLMDFGTGRDVADETRADRLDLSGTPVYMAPEIFKGEPASASSDLYSLGVLLFFLVSGRYPVEGRSVTDITLAHRSGKRVRLSDARPDLPQSFVSVVERALSAQPQDRSDSAGAMIAELARTGLAPGVDARGADVPQRRPAVTLARWTGAAVVLFLVVGGLGFLMCTAFDLTLERAGFSEFTPASWWIYGARSFVGPLVLTTFAVLGLGVVTAAFQIVRRVWPWARRATDRVPVRVAQAAARAGFADRQSIAYAVVLLQAVAVAAVIWRFRVLLSALTGFVSTASAASLATLEPSNPEPLTYRAVLTLLVLLMVAVWYKLLARRGGGTPVGRSAVAGGLAVIGLAVLLIEVPYCLFLQNDRPRTDLGGLRCYRIGARGDEVLLYCPNAPPRIRAVNAGEPQLAPAGKPESIFSAAR